jgi:hypothetical protein
MVFFLANDPDRIASEGLLALLETSNPVALI